MYLLSSTSRANHAFFFCNIFCRSFLYNILSPLISVLPLNALICNAASILLSIIMRALVPKNAWIASLHSRALSHCRSASQRNIAGCLVCANPVAIAALLPAFFLCIYSGMWGNNFFTIVVVLSLDASSIQMISSISATFCNTRKTRAILCSSLYIGMIHETFCVIRQQKNTTFKVQKS